MSIFLSYSRKDEEVVKVLAQGFDAARREVWFDHDLGGGDAWWDKILDNIRSATVFVFALSDDSLQSKPCRSELDYARNLDRPVLPVQVGRVTNFRSSPVADLQYIRFRSDDALSAFEIMAAIDDKAQQLKPLPDPLPTPPPIPYAYLLALGRQVDSTDLDQAQQISVVDQLNRAINEETDESVRGDALAILRNMLSKSWVTKRTENAAKFIIRTATTTEEEAALGESEQIRPPDQTDYQPEQTKPPHEEGDKEPQQVTSPDKDRDEDPQQTPTPPETSEADARARFVQDLAEREKRREAEKGKEGQRGATEGQRSSAPAQPVWNAPFATQTAPPNQHPKEAPVWPGVAKPLAPPPPPAAEARQPAVARPETRQPVDAPKTRLVMTPNYQAPKPPAHWVLSLIALIPTVLFGVVALAFSAQVGPLYRTGNIAGATGASKIARAWGIVGVVVNVLCIIIPTLS